MTSDGSHVWGVHFKSEGEKSIDWSEAAALMSAVRAYSQKRPEFPLVEPVLVILGSTPSEDLDAFAKEEGLRILTFTPEECARLLVEHNKSSLQALEGGFLKPIENVSNAEEVHA